MTPRQADILRIAIQSAIAAGCAFIAIGLTGTDQEFIAVISAVLVLQTSVDQTLESAAQRMVGTLIGTAVGIAALIVSGSENWISLSLSVLVMAAIGKWRPSWNYGTIAAIGMTLGAEGSLLETAQDRTIGIFLGTAIGTAVDLLVWPKRARQRVRQQLGEALKICRELVTSTIGAALSSREPDTDDLHVRFGKAIAGARETAGSIRLERAGRAGLYREFVHGVERLWHALIILDRVTEAQQDSPLPLPGDVIDQVRQMRRVTCDALEHAQRFEPIPHADLDKLAAGWRAIWQGDLLDERREEELQNVALVFGLCEVSRNLNEIDRSICAIRDSG